MVNIITFIKRHPLLTYFALTFVISWGCILLLIGPGGITGTKEVAEVLLPFVYIAALAGPSVAGILCTSFVYGRDGFRDLLSRLLVWRVGTRWYAVALLTAPLFFTAVLLVLSLLSPVYLPGIFTSDNKASLLLSGIMAGVMVGIFEELGWTGFAIPRLRLSYSVLNTGIMVGFMWGLWHFPLFSGSVFPSSEGIIPILNLSVLLFSFLPAFRVLMVWVYDHTKSLLVVMIMHASLSSSILIFPPIKSTVAQIVTYDLVFAAALWLFVAVVARANGNFFTKEIK